MPKQVIDRESLVSQAYAIASRDGISSLSVRKLASACGIAVGSVYGYFPTKADLTAAVLTRFFEENLSEELCVVRPGELAHIERGLIRVLNADEAVEHARLVGSLSAERLCRYVLRAIFASLMDSDECETLVALLDASLYPYPTPINEKDAR